EVVRNARRDYAAPCGLPSLLPFQRGPDDIGCLLDRHRDAGSLTRRLPVVLHCPNPLPVVAGEDPRDHAPALSLEGGDALTLRLEDPPKLGDEREFSTFVVLRLVRVEPKPSRPKVNVPPLARQDLRGQPPTCDVCHLERRAHRRRNVGEDRLEL